MLQVRDGYLDDLVDGGDEGQAVLGGNQVLLFLFGDAADAASVAAGRDGNCHLPAAKEEVAGRGARVVKRAVGMLGYDAITRECSLFLVHEASQGVPVKGTGVPFTRVICAQGGGIELAVHTGNSAVAKEGQWLGARYFFVGGQQGACVADGKQSSSSPSEGGRHYVSFACSALPDGQAIRHHCQRNAARQGNKIGGFQGTIAKGKRMQVALFTYLAAEGAVYKIWSHHGYPCCARMEVSMRAFNVRVQAVVLWESADW